MRSYWVLLCFTALVACSSGSSSDSANIDSQFVGLWDQTDSDDDVYYHYIGGDGIAVDYDYLGDSFDDIANCYEKIDYLEQRYYREGNNYRYTSKSVRIADVDILLSLDIVANELQATTLESDEEIAKGVVISLGTRVAGISITDIENQLCPIF